MTGVDVAAVAARFDVAGPVDTVETNLTGHINESHVVVARGRRYLLQRLNANVFAEPDAVMANVMTVTAHLRARGERTLTVVPVDGKPCWQRWRMYELVENAASAAVRSDADAEAAGRCLGRFHRCLADLDPGALHVTLPRFHDPARRLDVLRALAGADGGEPGAEVATMLGLAHLATTGTALASLPARVAHNDAKVDNILVDRRSRRPLMLVDLDTVMPGTILWDLGDLVRSATSTGAEDDPSATFDPDRYHALVGGWLAEVSGLLTLEERASVGAAGPVITYEQAIRFLTDHLQGDVYYRTARPGHNLDRARSQLGLLQSMIGALGAPAL